MKFSILTPLPPRTWEPHFLGMGGGVGGQNFFAHCGRCVLTQT